MTQSLDALIERLENALDSDLDLNFEICRACGDYPPDASLFRVWTGGYRVAWTDDKGRDHQADVHPVGSSLDAALALVARVLPGWLVAGLSQGTIDTKYGDVREWSGKRWSVTLVRQGDKLMDNMMLAAEWPNVHHKTPALAICLATLQALRKEKR